MKAAFVVMSILGCDDAGVACTPVAQVNGRWQTIAACDAASESHLSRYANANHPMVVAVCQTAGTTALADSTEDAAQFETASRSVESRLQPAEDVETERGFAARAIDLMKFVLPSRHDLKQTVSYPLHVVTDTYSWAAKKIAD